MAQGLREHRLGKLGYRRLIPMSYPNQPVTENFVRDNLQETIYRFPSSVRRGVRTGTPKPLPPRSLQLIPAATPTNKKSFSYPHLLYRDPFSGRPPTSSDSSETTSSPLQSPEQHLFPTAYMSPSRKLAAASSGSAEKMSNHTAISNSDFDCPAILRN